MNKKKEKPTILLIEDDPEFSRLIEESLSLRGHDAFDFECRNRLSIALERLREGGIDLILLDLSLSDSSGFETFSRVHAQSPDIPIVVLTGLDDESVAVKAIQEGAQDYLVKGEVGGDLLLRCIRYAIERKQQHVKLNEMLVRIKKSRDDMLSILNQLKIATVIIDENGNIAFLSQAGLTILGKSQEESTGKDWESLFPFQDAEKAELKEMSRKAPEMRTKVPVHIEAPGGRQYWIDVYVYDDPENSQRKIFYLYDMSDVYNLRRELGEKVQFHDLVGKSKPMQLIYQQIREVAKVDWTVLIEGQTGTGKELVARAIHFSSKRKDKPFLAVNCAGLPESLLASQLFGHRRGAFTGAVEDHQGLFEAAHGGTIFLDEIGDMPLSMQSSLLRAIEEKEITRLGETKVRKVDVRVITASNRDLSQAAQKGEFRMDLLYRIRVARISLPPLIERRDDIPYLVSAFLTKCRASTGKPVQNITNDVMRKLMEYKWPGNIRELRSAIECAVTRCKGTTLQVEDLPPELSNPALVSLQGAGDQDAGKEYILDALKRAGGRRGLAAELLGMSRATLYRRMNELNLKPPKKLFHAG